MDTRLKGLFNSMIVLLGIQGSGLAYTAVGWGDNGYGQCLPPPPNTDWGTWRRACTRSPSTSTETTLYCPPEDICCFSRVQGSFHPQAGLSCSIELPALATRPE